MEGRNNKLRLFFVQKKKGHIMEGKIITFLGPDHKVGTTTIAKAVAQDIARKNPEKKVLFIDAEGEYLGMWDAGIPKILEDKQDNIASIMKMARQKDNLYVIKSTRAENAAFHPDMAEFFIQTLKDSSGMDFIICAAGEIEHSMALGSIFAADAVYVVLTHGPYCEGCLRRFEWMRCLYEKLAINIKGLIINRYDKLSAYSPMYIMERLQVDESMLYKVRTAKNIDRDRFSLAEKDNLAFSKDIGMLVKEII